MSLRGVFRHLTLSSSAASQRLVYTAADDDNVKCRKAPRKDKCLC